MDGVRAQCGAVLEHGQRKRDDGGVQEGGKEVGCTGGGDGGAAKEGEVPGASFVGPERVLETRVCG